MISPQVYRLPRVKESSGLGRSSIYDLMKKGHFPASISLTPNGRSVGWLSTEVDAWIASRAKRGGAK